MIEQQLRELLMAEMSKRNMLLVAHWIEENPERFDVLLYLISLNEEPVSRRAAWVASISFAGRSELMQPHIEKVIRDLPGYFHSGVQRCMLKVISEIYVPAKYFGELANICFDWVDNIRMPLAVRALSMQILYTISEKEPELRPELIALFQNLAELSEDPAILSKSRILLQKLKKESLRN
jgi:hypothetical protein